MNQRGVFAVARAVFDHPIFAPEPYTEREAWMWMVGAALWKPKQVRAGRRMAMLQRGQLMYAERFLAEKWRWSKSSVRRFLIRLQSESMATLDVNRDATLITICNYEKYAFDGKQKESQPEPQSEPPLNRPWTKEEEGKKDKKDDGGERADLMHPLAFDLASELATICGFPDSTNWPPGWCGAPMWVGKCLAEGWFPQLMRDETRAVAKRKRDGPIESFRYLEKPLARAHALHAAPLPQVAISEPETIHARQSTRGNIIPAADRLAENIGGIFGERQVCSGPGADHVRLLPDGGRERPGDVHGGDSGGSGGIPAGGDSGGDGPKDGPATKAQVVAFRR